MKKYVLFAGVALALVVVSFLVVLALSAVGIVDAGNVFVMFVLPLFVGPAVVAVAGGYRSTGAATVAFVGVVPAVGAIFGLAAVSLTPEGIVGDGPLGLVLLVVALIGVVLAAAGFGVGAGLRAVTN